MKHYYSEEEHFSLDKEEFSFACARKTVFDPNASIAKISCSFSKKIHVGFSLIRFQEHLVWKKGAFADEWENVLVLFNFFGQISLDKENSMRAKLAKIFFSTIMFLL